MTRLNGSTPSSPTASSFNDHAGESCFVSPFRLNRPTKTRGPVLFDSPHSGEDYPAYVLQTTDRDAMETLADAKVNQLLQTLPKAGFATLCANFPRVMVDLNRSQVGSFDLIRATSTQRLPSDREKNLPCNMDIDIMELVLRLDKLYNPYHSMLKSTLNAYKAQFGHAVLLDMHSYSKHVVPKKYLDSIGLQEAPDIILGTHHGRSADKDLTETIAETFRQNGHTVLVDQLFVGAHIVKTHGSPQDNIHAIQIEMAENYFDRRTGKIIEHEAARLSDTLEQVGETALKWLKALPNYGRVLSGMDNAFQGQNLAL